MEQPNLTRGSAVDAPVVDGRPDPVPPGAALARDAIGPSTARWENVAHLLTLERPNESAELALARTA